ncbi:MAG: hypothetical protein IPJ85_12450 [Flavobacteriales bacterium]|nr:hypothetical protein [Flavobacteriales bacterium]
MNAQPSPHPRCWLAIGAIFTWAVLGWFGPACAQSTDHSSHMDSLTRILRPQIDDSNKVLTLLALAEIPVKGTSHTPVDNRTVHADFAFQALRLAQRLHWAKGEAYGAMYASMAKEQVGELDQALALLDSALLVSEGLDLKDRGVILQRAALVLAVRNIDFEKADSLTRLSMTCFRTCASPAHEGSGLELLARTQLIRQNWVAAIVAYTETIRFCELNRLPMTLAIANEKMGLIMATLGDVENATRYYRAAIHLCDSLGFGYRKYMGECNFGHLLLDNGLPGEALPWLNAASGTVLSYGLSPSNHFTAQGLRAHALLRLDSVETAGALIAELRKTAIEGGSILDYIEPIWLVKVRRPREAIAMLRAVYSSSPKVGLRSEPVNRTICEQLALAYRQLGTMPAHSHGPTACGIGNRCSSIAGMSMLLTGPNRSGRSRIVCLRIASCM